jgi:NAD(P)-dependent dehydrogenase (short-subunit alcohol dehydrogenase family)
MEREKRTFIITGGNSGLGYQCAKNIAQENEDNYVVIASRNREKSEQAAKELSNQTGNLHIYALPLNLASLASVREFCQTFVESNFPPLQGLVCNAITGSSTLEHTSDGFEQTFGVGHLGHFLLANMLLKTMRNDGRIIFVSSDQHNPPKILGRIHYTDALDLAYPKESNHTLRYSGTKLCNLYCAYEMASRINIETDKQITVNAFNPGFMADTGLSNNAKSFGERLAKRLGPLAARLLGTLSSAKQSGKCLAALMTDAQYNGITGKYFDRVQEIPSSELSYSKANAENLWKRSIELVLLQNDETIFPL